MKNCIFIENLDGEGPFYCGNTSDLKDLKFGIKNLLKEEINNWIENFSDIPLDIRFTTKSLTDEEIANIPEV